MTFIRNHFNCKTFEKKNKFVVKRSINCPVDGIINASKMRPIWPCVNLKFVDGKKISLLKSEFIIDSVQK